MPTTLPQEWAAFRRVAGNIASAWSLPVIIVTDPDPRLFMLLRAWPDREPDNDYKALR